MHQPKKRRRNILLTLAAIPLAYLLAIIIAASITLPATHHDAARPHTVYLASNGVHLNLILPVQHPLGDWHAFLPDAGLEDKTYLYIGWGSAAFYTQVHTWSDLRPGIALRALLYDRGLIRIEGVHNPPPAQHPQVRTLHLSDTQYRALIHDLQQQFTARQTLTRHPGFYPAHGRYTPLFTCNEWMRRRLRNIGLPTPLWSPFARPILHTFPASG